MLVDVDPGVALVFPPSLRSPSLLGSASRPAPRALNRYKTVTKPPQILPRASSSYFSWSYPSLSSSSVSLLACSSILHPVLWSTTSSQIISSAFHEPFIRLYSIFFEPRPVVAVSVGAHAKFDQQDLLPCFFGLEKGEKPPEPINPSLRLIIRAKVSIPLDERMGNACPNHMNQYARLEHWPMTEPEVNRAGMTDSLDEPGGWINGGWGMQRWESLCVIGTHEVGRARYERDAGEAESLTNEDKAQSGPIYTPTNNGS
ncbi:hypothetical protein C8R43DRAFT_1102678 [Mycena crocata]|nr:hypothetical protein C8R43DRAFT_1102678 [Mycena crocata]